MDIEKDMVMDALSNVQDPELHKGLLELGMIREVEISGEAVRVTIALTMADCPMKEQIKKDVMETVQKVEGVGHVEVVLSTMTSEERARLFGQEPDEMEGIKGVKNIIAVGSGKGGVGKTTVTVNLAAALHSKGFRIGILDADVHGPDIPIMLGVDERPLGSRGMLLPVERYGIKVMSTGMLAGEGVPIVWRGPLVNKAIKDFLGRVQWGELDVLLVDLPPGTGDAAITVANSVPLTGVIIVTTPQKVAISDVRRSIGLFKSKNIKILGIVENMSYLKIKGAQGEELLDIFGKGGGEKIARAFRLPFLGAIPIDPSIRQGGDEGKPQALDVATDAWKEFAAIADRIIETSGIRLGVPA